MPRHKPLSREERLELRRRLAERAGKGELALPAAIVEIRHALGMTQEQFGKTFQLTRRQVSELETGVGNPTAETLNRIAKPFGFAVGLVPAPQKIPN